MKGIAAVRVCIEEGESERSLNGGTIWPAALTAHEWSVFFLSGLCNAAAARGAYKNWLPNNKSERNQWHRQPVQNVNSSFGRESLPSFSVQSRCIQMHVTWLVRDSALSFCIRFVSCITFDRVQDVLVRVRSEEQNAYWSEWVQEKFWSKGGRLVVAPKLLLSFSCWGYWVSTVRAMMTKYHHTLSRKFYQYGITSGGRYKNCHVNAYEDFYFFPSLNFFN